MKINSTYLIISFLWFLRLIAAAEEGQDMYRSYISITEAPFILVVAKNTTNGILLECLATLIHKRWALTSCYCLRNLEDQFIGYGISDVKQFSKNQILEIDEIIYHPGYHKHLSINDIAIVKLKKPVQFTDHVQKIDLEGVAWPQDKRQLFRNCISYKFGTGVTKLHSKNVIAKHGKDGCYCYPYIRNICLELSVDTLCFSDYGGPLVCDGKFVGVAQSFAHLDTCDGIDATPVCGSTNALSIYTFICPYLKWIKTYVKTTPSPPASCDALRKCEISNLSIMILVLNCIILMYKKNLH